MKLLPTLAAVVLVGGLVSGCGKNNTATPPTPTPSGSAGAAPSLQPGPSGAPALGAALTGKGYTLTIPKKWTDITAAMKNKQASIDVAARQTTQTPPFTANFNVQTDKSQITGTVTQADLDMVAAKLKKQSEGLGPGVVQGPAISLAGAPTLHQEGPAKSGKVTFYLDQYDALHAGTNYLISFGFPTSMPAKQRTKIVTAVLSSWQWS